MIYCKLKHSVSTYMCMNVICLTLLHQLLGVHIRHVLKFVYSNKLQWSGKTTYSAALTICSVRCCQCLQKCSPSLPIGIIFPSWTCSDWWNGSVMASWTASPPIVMLVLGVMREPSWAHCCSGCWLSTEVVDRVCSFSEFWCQTPSGHCQVIPGEEASSLVDPPSWIKACLQEMQDTGVA